MTELLDLVVQLLDLLGELACPVPPRAGHGLVRREHQRAKAGRAMERRERHHRDDRRAVGDRDDPRRSLERLRVDLGDDERHVRLHPERRRLVDADDPRGGRLPHEPSSDRCASSGEGEVDSAKGIEGQLPHRDVASRERDRPSGGPGRGQRDQLVDRERAGLQDAQHLGTHRAGGAHDGDLQAHGSHPTRRTTPGGRGLAERPGAEDVLELFRAEVEALGVGLELDTPRRVAPDEHDLPHLLLHLSSVEDEVPLGGGDARHSSLDDVADLHPVLRGDVAGRLDHVVQALPASASWIAMIRRVDASAGLMSSS